MTMYVTAGGKLSNKRGRVGGEKAWRQHRYDDKHLTAACKARRDELAAQTALEDLELGDEGSYIPVTSDSATRLSSAAPVPYDGCVEVDAGVILVYRGGKLSAALCG